MKIHILKDQTATLCGKAVPASALGKTKGSKDTPSCVKCDKEFEVQHLHSARAIEF
jgi:hypothetical protein